MQVWHEAMWSALYGPDGFYLRHTPSEHFRTSASASTQFAHALARLAAAVDESLGHPAVFDLVDVGAGDGSLLAGVLGSMPPDLAARTRAVAVDLRPRPQSLPVTVQWVSHVPRPVTGLVMAHELLDNLPCDVIERIDGELRYVQVDIDGRELPGPTVTFEHRRWLDRWWPLDRDGDRAEGGASRDQMWADLIASLASGLALAVDFGHLRDERVGGAFAAGTLTGYRNGAQVMPVPDGSCDLTAHVAIDACAEAGSRAGAEHSHLVRQREALRVLGLTAATPPRALAHADPAGYVRQLSAASEAAELLDPSSLGSFWWLLQSKGVALPSMGSDTLSG
jgi:SAM-dependent MidA family methyltransferase